MSERFQPPRGTRDWFGDDAAVRRHVIDLARSVFEPAGYGEVVTPGFEDTELFARSSGETSDVVSKEMYTFEDRSGRSLTLRPESTAPVMRAYLDGMSRLPQPVKVWYCQSHFRYNAVQRGRAREHYQFGVEVVGSPDAAVDAEVIALQHRWYRLCGVPELRLELNSIGDATCRPAYVALLVEYIDAHIDQLDDECRERRKTNPLRVLDCKNSSCQAVLADAPRITDHLCEDCAAHFAEVRRHLDARGVAYELVPTLVRGLDYYTARPGSGAGRAWPPRSRRWPLRRPGRADRRPGDARRRFRRRDRAAARGRAAATGGVARPGDVRRHRRDRPAEAVRRDGRGAGGGGGRRCRVRISQAQAAAGDGRQAGSDDRGDRRRRRVGARPGDAA